MMNIMTRQLNIFERLPGSERSRCAPSLLIRENRSLLIKNQMPCDQFDAVRVCCERSICSESRCLVRAKLRGGVILIVTADFSCVLVVTSTSGVEMKNPNSKTAKAFAVGVRSRQQSGLLEQRLVSFG